MCDEYGQTRLRLDLPVSTMQGPMEGSGGAVRGRRRSEERCSMCDEYGQTRLRLDLPVSTMQGPMEGSGGAEGEKRAAMIRLSRTTVVYVCVLRRW